MNQVSLDKSNSLPIQEQSAVSKWGGYLIFPFQMLGRAILWIALKITGLFKSCFCSQTSPASDKKVVLQDIQLSPKQSPHHSKKSVEQAVDNIEVLNLKDFDDTEILSLNDVKNIVSQNDYNLIDPSEFVEKHKETFEFMFVTLGDQSIETSEAMDFADTAWKKIIELMKAPKETHSIDLKALTEVFKNQKEFLFTKDEIYDCLQKAYYFLPTSVENCFLKTCYDGKALADQEIVTNPLTKLTFIYLYSFAYAEYDLSLQ